jgi:hypothetical protein
MRFLRSHSRRYQESGHPYNGSCLQKNEASQEVYMVQRENACRKKTGEEELGMLLTDHLVQSTRLHKQAAQTPSQWAEK